MYLYNVFWRARPEEETRPTGWNEYLIHRMCGSHEYTILLYRRVDKLRHSHRVCHRVTLVLVLQSKL
jgi:hypothetical protein